MRAAHRQPADATTRFAGTVLADVGAGTGILTRMLAGTAATVNAVEPNGPMLAALGWQPWRP